MIDVIKQKLGRYIKRDNELSQKILKNVLLSFGVKGGSILIGLVLVPLTISYIDPTQYGIWLTISSIVSWMSFFDIGMGNGLRNKLATAIALGKLEDAKSYVSTTYATLILVATFIFILFFVINPFLNWRSILNIPDSMHENMQSIILIVISCFCLQFVVQLVNTVLTAMQEPALSGVISFFGQLFLLISVFFIKHFIPGSLHILVSVLTFVPMSIILLASVLLYRTRLKFVSPSISFVDFRHAKTLFSVGSTFFLIQIGALILFQTDNIIIARLSGLEAVTIFNVAYKLFSVVTMTFTILMTPYWSAFTSAYAKDDFPWMIKNMYNLRKIWVIFSLIIVPTVILSSKFIFKVWIGEKVLVPESTAIWMGIYVVNYTCLCLSCFFLNGIGKLRIQLYLYLIVSVLNIPFCVFLAKTNGINGVIVANVSAFIIMNLILWIQSNKILHNRATGLWNK